MEMSQLDSDLRLPPRKRLLAGYMKLNGIGSSSSSSTSPSAALAFSSSTSNSIGSSSSSASTSRFHSVQNQSPEELVEAARSAAAVAVKAAKAARAIANEKALISSKAIAAAKRALELVDSFPKEAMADCKEKKHVSVDNLSSKDLACRLQRAIERRYPKVLAIREENGQINKKQKMNKTVADGGSSVTGYVNGIAGVVERETNIAYQSGSISSVVDTRMSSVPAECIEKFATLALRCCREETDARPSMAEVVRELEIIWELMPESKTAKREDMSETTSQPSSSSNSSFLKNPNPYTSMDVSGSDLVSGIVPSVAPR